MQRISQSSSDRLMSTRFHTRERVRLVEQPHVHDRRIDLLTPVTVARVMASVSNLSRQHSEHVTMNLRGSETVVRRIVDNRKRMEESPRGATRVVSPRPVVVATATKPNAAPHVSRSPASLPNSMTSAAQPTIQTPSRAATTEQSTVNIEAISEQVLKRIDRRITSWRERMGKV